MRNNFKKIMSLIITLSLALSFIGLSVYADDNINLEEYSLTYAKPLFTGEIEYPKIVDDSIIGSVPKFEDGDRVAFIGDSISHGTMGAYYCKQIFSYYVTRYPDVKFSYVNKSINGSTAKSTVSRITHDLLEWEYEKPYNKAVILLGTNDMQRTEYFEGSEKEEGAFERRAMLFSDYYSNLNNIVLNLKQAGIENVYLMSAPMFDQWLKYGEDENGNKISGPGTGYSSNPVSVDFNNIIRKGGSIAYNIAVNQNARFIDINTPQTIVQYYNRFYKNDELFTMAHDRIHPYEEAHYIMSYVFLKAQGETGEVATVSINANDNSINLSNATATELKASNNEVSYTYKANSLPLAADSTYRKAEKYLPLTEELNREIIKVSGLNDGIYDIIMDGAIVATVSKKQLEEGVNIADMENNPGQKQALLVFGIAEARRNLDTAHRDFIQDFEISYISKYKLNTESNASLIASANEWIKNNPQSEADIKLLEAYIEYKNSEKETIEKINSYEDLIYSVNKPTEHKVEIKKSTSDTVTPYLKPVYIDYKIPEEIYDIKKPHNIEKITVRVNEELLNLDVNPVIIDGRTLVPLRAIFEALGATVEWDEATATATATLGPRVIKLTENDKNAYLNGDVRELDVPALIINGRFLVPVRFVSETLGANVFWDDWEQCVLVNYKKNLVPNAVIATPVSQSGDDGTGNDIFNSVDGDIKTRWAVSGKDGEAWGIYDLGEVYTLDKMKISYMNGTSRIYYFDLEVSDDGKNFTKVLEGVKTSGTTNDYEEISLENIKARYIKYVGGGNSQNLWNSITEIMFIKK